jgi:hypothetical protein
MDAGQRQEPLWPEEQPDAPCVSQVNLAAAYELVRDAEQQWREESRIPALEALLERTNGLELSRDLLLLLLEELAIDDDFDEIVGNPDNISPARFPQAIAMALALRHSWRRDDFESLASVVVNSTQPQDSAGRRRPDRRQ